MAEFVSVVGAGPGWTRVRTSDGQTVTLKGTRNWRNNNPGNIEYGSFAKSMGAVGTDGRFAVFPTYDAGRQAKSSLLFDSPKYNTKTIHGAISRYAPPKENNTKSYVNRVARALGLSSDTPMAALDENQRGTMMDAMQRVEGFRVGKAFDEQGNVVDPSALQSNQTGGIMAAINPDRVPTPSPSPLSQAVERRELPAIGSGLLAQSRAAQTMPSVASASAVANIQGPGWETPFAGAQQQAAEQPGMSMANQYASYGAGKAQAAQNGLLADDVAYQRAMDGMKQGLLAQKAAYYQEPVQSPLASVQPVQPVEVPQQVQQVQQPAQPVSYEQTASVPGLLSPQEQQMFDAQRNKLDFAPINRKPQIGNAVKGILGTIGGGILGGLLAGPIGALGGGMLANSMMTPGGVGNRDFPKQPDSQPRGDGKETSYGRSVRESSHQYDNAVRNGSVGLY